MHTKFIREARLSGLDKQEIEEIIEIIKKRPKQNTDREIAKRFFRALFFAAEKLKNQKIIIPKIKKAYTPKIPTKTIEEIKKLENPPIKRVIKSEKYPLLVSKNIVLASALIQRNKYTLIEPLVNKNLIKYIIKKISPKYKKNKNVLESELLTKLINKATKKFKIDYSEELNKKIRYFLFRDLEKFGKIDPLIRDQRIEKIICDGENRPIQIEHIRYGRIITNVILNEKEIEDTILKFASVSDQKLDNKNPELNVKIEDFRVIATLGFKKIRSKFVIKKEGP